VNSKLTKIAESRFKSDAYANLEWDNESKFFKLVLDNKYLIFKIDSQFTEFEIKGELKNKSVNFPIGNENNQLLYYLSQFDELNKNLENSNDKEYKRNLSAINKLKKEIYNKHSHSWACRFALAMQKNINAKKTTNKNSFAYAKQYFKYFSFSDSLLLESPVFDLRIKQYFKEVKLDSLIQTKNISQIGNLITNLYGISEHYWKSHSQITNYLIPYFENSGLININNLIRDAYSLFHTCEYKLNSEEGNSRINFWQNKNNIDLKDLAIKYCNKNYTNTNEIEHNLLCIIVWTQMCDHSLHILKELDKLYSNYNDFNLTILTVCIDTAESYWENYYENLNNQWIHICDPYGIYGEWAKRLNIIYAPSLFLFDNDANLISTAITSEQLEKQIQTYYNLNIISDNKED
jgi:hypothetical protein